MALFHFSVKIISRANGQSACAAAAYRSGEEIRNDYDGCVHDYRKKQSVERSVIMLPENAPAEYADRQTLWNAVESSEKSSNARLAREVEFALPRELDPEVRQRIALEFINDNFVAKGMIADVSFHNPPRRDSHNRPVDAVGNLVTDPADYIYDNPHVHVLLTLRAIGEDGKWQAKHQKAYICEKDGQQKLFTASEYKSADGWEKLYPYTDTSGGKVYHTRRYVSAHPEEGLKSAGRDPKSEAVENPVTEEWNRGENVELWREAWAKKLNHTYKAAGLDLRVDHRSYERQESDIIPTIHEGKAVTIEEKKLKEEYEAALQRGETPQRKHSRIRQLNIDIQAHNRALLMRREIQQLQETINKLLSPVKQRIEESCRSIAERMEHLRVRIIEKSVLIKRADSMVEDANLRIKDGRAFVESTNLPDSSNLILLEEKLQKVYREITASKSILHRSGRKNLEREVKTLELEIRVFKENQLYVEDTEREMQKLEQGISELESKISILESERIELEEKYEECEAEITNDNKLEIIKSRTEIRNMDNEIAKQIGCADFWKAAEEFDGKHDCTFGSRNREEHIENMNEANYSIRGSGLT